MIFGGHIKLKNIVHHNRAEEKIKKALSALDLIESDITQLSITADSKYDSGYTYYEISCSDYLKLKFRDDGKIINGQEIVTNSKLEKVLN